MKKYLEYKIKMTEIDLLVDHYKAVEAADILKKFSNNNIKPFEISILTKDEEERLKKLYPAKVRNEIKHRWSYQFLLRELANDNHEYEAQVGSVATYSLTSHFCHYDWSGVSSRQAQIANAHSSNESEIYDIGHAMRILANLLSFEVFRVAEYMRGNNYNSKEASYLSMEIIDFIEELIEKENNIIDIMT